MPSNYINHLPKPLLQDLVAGRWLPIVGSGLSKNAILPSPKTMPLWNDLGKSLANELQDYDYVNATDAISAYEHEFGRPKFLERLSELLFVTEAQPGAAHGAFCTIPFDIVCTTNFDFLLERQYDLGSMPCTPIIDEDQLSVNLPKSTIALLKLHGDLNHPNRLVATEENYDKFLENYPVIATYLSNLLITRTAVLIGYSLDDPDFRQIWQVVGERLGRMRRLAYVLCVGASDAEIARFNRRGVKAINLDTDKEKYGEIYSQLFTEIGDYWRERIVTSGQVTEEEPLRELSLPGDSATRLCYFAIPWSAHPFYRERVFPLVRDAGLVPVTGDELLSPGDNILAKVDALVSRASLVVVDASSQHTLIELRMVIGRTTPGKLCIVVEEGRFLPAEMQSAKILYRPSLTSDDISDFLSVMEEWFGQTARELESQLAVEPKRLIGLGEYRAAIISAITYLETGLRQCLDHPVSSKKRRVSIRELLIEAENRELLLKAEVTQVLEWLKVRNIAVHINEPVSAGVAVEIVRGSEEITHKLVQA